MQFTKYLQAQGIGSRKLCQALIADERVAINGAIIADSKAEIAPESVHELRIDDEAYAPIPLPFYYIRLHKPAGYETSHKPRDYPSVFSLLPPHIRATHPQAIGRLDADTTGVLIITNDGNLNHRLTSPKYHAQKHYVVTLKHPADETLCARLCAGVLLADEEETVRALSAELMSPTQLKMVLTEGKYHQVKRMVAAVGNRVEALHRERFHHWHCDDLAPNEWQFFEPETEVVKA